MGERRRWGERKMERACEKDEEGVRERWRKGEKKMKRGGGRLHGERPTAFERGQ